MKKQCQRILAVILALCLSIPMLSTTFAASYYPRYTGNSGSIVTALSSVGVDSSYSNRSKIAAANGIGGYSGTAAQNTQMLTLLKQGKLIMPSAAGTSSGAQYAPRYTGSSNSLTDALKSVNIDASYSNRAKLAALNGITSYQGTASQNTKLLQLLKAGQLKISGIASTPPSSPAPSTPSGALLNNTVRIAFIRQGSETCKATSLAMMLNVMSNANKFSTSVLGGSCCRSIDGMTCTANGTTYVATYKTDGYVGSRQEVEYHIQDALANGLPIVVAVHKNGSGTRHHWVVVVGRSGNDYLIVDPATNGSGTMASQAKSMAALGYSLGLTDYSTPHYGYICFHER